MPYTADMTVALIGTKDIDKECGIFLNIEKGEQFAADMEGRFLRQEPDEAALEAFRGKRAAQKKELFDQISVDGFDMQKAFDYLPGRDIEEGIPFITFKPEEFAGIA